MRLPLLPAAVEVPSAASEAAAFAAAVRNAAGVDNAPVFAAVFVVLFLGLKLNSATNKAPGVRPTELQLRIPFKSRTSVKVIHSHSRRSRRLSHCGASPLLKQCSSHSGRASRLGLL